MKIRIKENNKNVQEFNLLYDSVGWGAYDKNISKKALDNTYYSVSINNWLWKINWRCYLFYVYT